MKAKEVEDLADNGIYRGKRLEGVVEETHISWVILTDEFAFKLKKPLKLSFLDYSSLELRRKYCEKELELNRRYTDIYLSVLPVRKLQGQWVLGGENGDLVDFVVQMKKMAGDKQMDRLLAKGNVSKNEIASLAKEVAAFHQNAEIIRENFDGKKARDLFNDLSGVRGFIKDQLGAGTERIILDAMKWSDAILEKHANRFQERIEAGFKRDLHGDLHSGNIFLYDPPILFDCIEFNDVYRQIDVLYEIAFLCMDLEAFGKKELVDHFLSEYENFFKIMPQEKDKEIFIYFKGLRANIRAKIHAISAKQAKDTHSRNTQLDESEKYLLLVRDYINRSGI